MARYCFVVLLTIAASAGLADVSRASILLDGKTLGYAYEYPTSASPIFQTSFVVGPGVELAGVLSNNYASLDVSDTNIYIDYYQGVNWTGAAFNGIRLRDQSFAIDPITSVTINGATNMPGFTAARITFDADNIYINWQGLGAIPGTIVSLDINGGDGGTVPELASVATWGILSLIAGAWYRRSR